MRRQAVQYAHERPAESVTPGGRPVMFGQDSIGADQLPEPAAKLDSSTGCCRNIVDCSFNGILVSIVTCGYLISRRCPRTRKD